MKPDKTTATTADCFLAKAKLAILKRGYSLKYLAQEEGYGLWKFETTAYHKGTLSRHSVVAVGKLFDKYATSEDRRRLECISQCDSATFAKYHNRTIRDDEFRSLLRYFFSISETDVSGLLGDKPKLHESRNVVRIKKNNVHVSAAPTQSASFGLGQSLVTQICQFIRQQNAKKTDL